MIATEAGLLRRAVEYVATAAARTWEIVRRDEPGTRRVLLATYWRIKLRSAWCALLPRFCPERERILSWTIRVGDYSDFVNMFEEIFISQSYRLDGVREQARIIDCGANIGLATLYFRWRFPRSTITAIEPEPGAFERLASNVEANRLYNVTVLNKAVGDGAGTVSFAYSPGRPASPIAGSGTPTLTESVEVELVPVSSLIDEPVDILKLDVEGAEVGVIEDLVRSGAIERIDRIALEYHHHLRPHDDRMGHTIGLLEGAGFGYQLMKLRTNEPGSYQDMIIHAYRI